jgi:hypothetical protein
MAVFPDIVRDLTDAGRQTDIPEVTKRYAKVLHYNVPNGKKNRGLATVVSYKMLEKEENLTPESIRLANIMGWCVELVSISKFGSFQFDSKTGNSRFEGSTLELEPDRRRLRNFPFLAQLMDPLCLQFFYSCKNLICNALTARHN